MTCAATRGRATTSGASLDLLPAFPARSLCERGQCHAVQAERSRLSEASARVPNNHSCCRSHGHCVSSLTENKQIWAGMAIAFIPSELSARVPIPLGMLVRELPPKFSYQTWVHGGIKARETSVAAFGRHEGLFASPRSSNR